MGLFGGIRWPQALTNTDGHIENFGRCTYALFEATLIGLASKGHHQNERADQGNAAGSPCRGLRRGNAFNNRRLLGPFFHD